MQIQATLYVNDVVTDALDFLRIGTQFTPLSGYDEERGVKVLNEVLAEMNANAIELPYFYDTTFSTVVNQQRYLIGTGALADVNQNYLVDVSFVTVTYDSVRRPVRIIQDLEALANYVPQNLQTLPGSVRVYHENDVEGDTYTVLDFFYPANGVYTISVRGKPYLAQVGFTDTIGFLPIYYRSFLKLEVARRLAPYYGLENIWTPQAEALYQESLATIQNSTTMDLSVNTDDSMLQNWAYGWGWRLGVIT